MKRAANRATKRDLRLSLGREKELLQTYLEEKFPTADLKALQRAANHISGFARDYDRSNIGVKAMRGRNGIVTHREASKPPALLPSLRRLLAASSSSSPWVWYRAWAEANREAINYIVIAAGGHDAFNELPTMVIERPARDFDLMWDRVIAETNSRNGFPTSIKSSKRRPATFEIPEPEPLRGIIPAAIELAQRDARHHKAARDQFAAELWRAYEWLTGSPVKQPANGGAGNRYGGAIDFLRDVEKFYSARWFHNVYRSGDRMQKIIDRLR